MSLQGQTITIGGLSGTSATSLVSNDSAIPATLTVSPATANAYAGLISDGTSTGALSLVVAGAGSLSLGGQNTYSGGTSINSGSTLRVASNSTINTGTLVSGPIGTGALTLPAGSTLGDDGNFRSIANNVAINGNVTFTSTGSGGVILNGTALGTPATTTLANNPTLTVNNTLTINNVLSGTGQTLTKAGTGTLVLTNSNTYDGGTVINQGTLAVYNSTGFPPPVGTANPLGTGGVTLAGGTLALRGQPLFTAANSSTLQTGLYAQFYQLAAQGSTANFTSLPVMTAHFQSITSNVVSTTNGTADNTLNWPNNGAGNLFDNQGFTPGGTPATANYEAYMTGVVNITTPGTYVFQTSSDDGSMLFLDNSTTPTVNNNNFQGPTAVNSAPLQLSSGPHTITLGYYQGGGGAQFSVSYQGPDTGGNMVTIPNSAVAPLNGSQGYTNNVAVTSNSGIDVSGSLGAIMAGTVTFQNPNLTLTSSSADGTTFGYTLALGSVGGVTINGNTTIQVNNSAGGGTGSVSLGAVGQTGASSIVKTGPGVLKMYSPGAYSGGTTVSQGTVAVSLINGAANNPLGAGNVTLSGGTLALRGSQQSANSGLLANYYNSNENAGSYSQLNALGSHLATLTPAVTAPTTTGGQANLDFSTAPPATPNDIFASQGFISSGGGNNYAAYMTGVLNITTPGSYTLYTESDDGSALWIDNQNLPIVNNAFDQGPTTRISTPVTLSAGPHLIAIGYYQHGGGAFLQVGYNGSDTQDQNTIIPNSVLTQLDTSQSYANNVVVTSNSDIDVSGSLSATLGTLSLGSNTLTISSADASSAAYFLTMGATTLTGNPTFNVTNSAGAALALCRSVR